ncbi:MAG: hypothetical protein ACP5GD_01125 [Candidatus Micrarchaeia archaeon]
MPKQEEDELWLLRKVLSRPNYAVLKLLLSKSPRTTHELYTILGKQFTRKTLIIALRTLSINYNILQPTHIRTERGYDLGYSINEKIKNVIKEAEKLEKIAEQAINTKKSKQ